MTIEPLNAEDRAALEHEFVLGRRICEFYLDQPGELTLDAIDRVLDLWFIDPRQGKPTGNDIARGLGSLIGDEICNRFQCRWVVVTDSVGCDLGVLDEATDWQMFPRHWLAKRLDPVNARTRVVSTIVQTLNEEGVIERRS